MKNNKPAFTLIELLVVIAIIGILATISVLALANARSKSRDAKRAGDAKQIQTALELFFNDNNRYPTVEEWNTGKIYSTTTGSTSTYMQIIPNAPTPADGLCTDTKNTISYTPSSDWGSYSISFCLGNTTGTLTPGPKCLTPGGIMDVDCSVVSGGSTPSFVCGADTVSYDGGPNGAYSYPTVLVDGQCWFKENLRTTKYNDGSNIPNITDNTQWQNNTTGAYAWYNNDYATYGSNYGAYYNFYAINPVSNGGKNVCPVGWRVPTDSDLNDLDQFLTDQPNTCDANRVGAWDCSGAGTKILVGGSSGLNLPLAGYRNVNGVFNYLGQITYLRSSTASGIGAFTRYFVPSLTTDYRYNDYLPYGFSVRCLKD